MAGIAMAGPALPPIGGASVLFKALTDRADQTGVNLSVVDIPVGVRGPRSRAAALVRYVRVLWSATAEADVLTVHLPTPQLSSLGLVALGICRLRRLPLVVRKFGGTDPRSLNPAARFVSFHVLRKADACFAESKKQCRDLSQALGRPVYWYPNNRPLGSTEAAGAYAPGRRFVYLGHVRPEKGLPELIAAVESMEGVCEVDVYGPFHGGMTASDFDRCRWVRYRGVLQPDDVVDALRSYAALLLPTYWPGEGYPGVILEAYQAGLPVITTRWGVVPEIVDETSGVLVEPQSVNELRAALHAAVEDPVHMQRMHEGAKNKAAELSSEKWGDLFLAFLGRLSQASSRGQTCEEVVVSEFPDFLP